MRGADESPRSTAEDHAHEKAATARRASSVASWMVMCPSAKISADWWPPTRPTRSEVAPVGRGGPCELRVRQTEGWRRAAASRAGGIGCARSTPWKGGSPARSTGFQRGRGRLDPSFGRIQAREHAFPVGAHGAQRRVAGSHWVDRGAVESRCSGAGSARRPRAGAGPVRGRAQRGDVDAAPRGYRSAARFSSAPAADPRGGSPSARGAVMVR
jgi:hypothetical protein